MFWLVCQMMTIGRLFPTLTPPPPPHPPFQDAEHSLITGVPELIQSVISLVHSINTGEQRPHMTWTFNDTFDGSSIIVKCSEPPSAVRLAHRARVFVAPLFPNSII